MPMWRAGLKRERENGPLGVLQGFDRDDLGNNAHAAIEFRGDYQRVWRISVPSMPAMKI